MTIKTNDDLVVRLYRSYVRLKHDIRADDDLDRRFERALDAVETQLATRHPHHVRRPHRRSRLAGSARSVPRRRTAITAAAVTLCTTIGGVLQGAVGAVISLSVGLLLACTVAVIHHGPARHD
ncbi:hypothetical protein [Streptomyces europaeiscabiei]|uniref:hypothetical protein n=1 Tax=Streptomyces europaeiscabiei TaxID=146819 RepID=UPI0013C4B434|nr:hypothetical protein [Streptomyces europaeiscabiei]